MSDDDRKILRERLERKQKQLDLVLAIDNLRDTLPEPSPLMMAIVSYLAEQFEADLCLLLLVDRETGDLELRTVRDRTEGRGRLTPEIVSDLLDRAIGAGGIAAWERKNLPGDLASKDKRERMHIAMAAISTGSEKLGGLLLARPQPAFTPEDVELLRIAESQLDSAVVQMGLRYELGRRNKELETIYRIDHVRDSHLPFDEMLGAVLHELCDIVEAEMGFIMLHERAGRLELRVSTHDNLFRVSPYYDIVDRLAQEALERAEMVCRNDVGDVLRSVMCTPLILQGEVLGIFGAANRYGPRGFSAEDRRLIGAVASQIDTAIFERRERRRLRRLLGRSVDPRVLERLLASPDTDFLKGERSVLSVLYADIRGSTRLADRTAPEQLVGFMNDFFARMTEVVLAHEGMIDKFIGDGVMALFGAPAPQADHALRAVRAGLAMQGAHRKVMEAWKERGIDPAPAGVGIATGELTVGEIGSPRRTGYSVIGWTANLGSRICDVAGADEVLVSQGTYDLIHERVEARPVTGLRLKGLDEDVTAYRVMRIRE